MRARTIKTRTCTGLHRADGKETPTGNRQVGERGTVHALRQTWHPVCKAHVASPVRRSHAAAVLRSSGPVPAPSRQPQCSRALALSLFLFRSLSLSLSLSLHTTLSFSLSVTHKHTLARTHQLRDRERVHTHTPLEQYASADATITKTWSVGLIQIWHQLVGSNDTATGTRFSFTVYIIWHKQLQPTINNSCFKCYLSKRSKTNIQA